MKRKKFIIPIAAVLASMTVLLTAAEHHLEEVPTVKM